MSDEIRMNPAALSAAVRGNFANAIIAATPGGIEAQEARGQRDFVAGTTLPGRCTNCTQDQLEAMGIVFGNGADDLFVNVQLPDGWTKQSTEHAMHSYLLDARGRKRAAIFYKAAFYDRRADMRLVARYSARVEPVGGYDAPDYRAARWHCVVYDCDAIVWHSETMRPEPTYRAYWLAWMEEKDALHKTGIVHLDERFPDWRDPLAYWD